MCTSMRVMALDVSQMALEVNHHVAADPGFEDRGGAHFFRISYCTPPPLRGFPEGTIKVYTWIIFRISFS